MSSDPPDAPEDVAPERREAVLSALGDPDCRRILTALASGPQTADELEANCGVSSSTLYRKLNELLEAGLVVEDVEIATRGRNATTYRRRVERLLVELRADGVALAEAQADTEPAE